jgi:hypothetical protein
MKFTCLFREKFEFKFLNVSKNKKNIVNIKLLIDVKPFYKKVLFT